MTHNLFNHPIYLLAATLLCLWGPGLPVAAQTGPPTETEQYTIRKGDTLWDISGDKLQNPFLWTELWKANPYIVNPDLIYPDNRLIIPLKQPTVEPTAPPEANPVPAPSAPESPAPEITEPPATQEGEQEQRAEQQQEEVAQEQGQEAAGSSSPPTGGGMALLPPSQSVKPMEGTTPAGTPGPAVSDDLILSSGFITQDLSPTGVIAGVDPQADPKNLLSQGDRIAIRWGKGTAPGIGEMYALYRPVHPVRHPETGQNLGDLVEVVGTVKIASTQGPSGIGVIVSSFNYAFSGDRLVPFRELDLPGNPPSASPAPGTQSVPTAEGTIVDILHGKILAGQYDVVYLDRGSSQGVIPGRRFSAHRENLEVGKLLVISVQKNTATALVTQSREALVPGDKVR